MIRKAESRDLSRIAEILVFVKRIKFLPIFKDEDYSFNTLQVLSVARDYDKPEILNKIYVYDDRLVISDVFGKTKDIYWEDINTVERPGMQRAARFNCAGDVSFTVSGANKNYKKFMNFLEPKLKGNKGKKLLAQIERNLK